MSPIDYSSWALREKARQEIYELWGNVLPIPILSLGLLLEDVDWRIRSLDMGKAYGPSGLDMDAALEVVEAYLL